MLLLLLHCILVLVPQSNSRCRADAQKYLAFRRSLRSVAYGSVHMGRPGKEEQ